MFSRWLVLACLISAGMLVASELRAQSYALRVGEGQAEFNGTTSVPILLDSDDPVQGLVAVVEWDGRKGQGVALSPADAAGGALENAEFVQTRLESEYAVLSAIIDIDGQGVDAIPAGNDTQIATLELRCICEGDRQDIVLVLPPKSHRAAIEGGPVVQNTIVVDGQAIQAGNGLELGNGTLVCNADGEPAEGVEVTCGDVDENGLVIEATGEPGGTTTVCFFYRSEVTEDPTQRIQGFQLGVSYDCQLSCIEDSVALAGPLAEIEAEFLMAHCESDETDGDGCELVAGILIDAMPPFDGRTLPGTDTFEPFLCVDFEISPEAACGSELAVEFQNGVDGRGQVPIANLVSINNFDATFEAIACSVRVAAPAGSGEFLRGDCNFNSTVNVADAAALVSHLFLEGPLSFEAPCEDACDANDDGQLAVNDVAFLLQWLFVVGSPAPPAPGPVNPGVDPTADNLTCGAGDGICPENGV
ncbi:MAG TPA: hypothetical protein VK116_05470 [Planctomycetota bacterium]|nr:hypothetical protein [Planctomycetota bacterium]